MKLPLGFIVYEGPSEIDPSVNIAVIVNCLKTRSVNSKTGALAQTYIIRTDMKPNEAVRTGADHAVCGRCPFAGGKGCYVLIKTVCSVYAAYKRGRYTRKTPDEVGAVCASLVRKRWLSGLRVGTYGDPAAAPVSAWAPMVHAVRAVNGKTSGYTHQWAEKYAFEGRTADAAFKDLVMASAHGATDAGEAAAKGWRAFTVFSTLAELRQTGRMALCPATNEANNRHSCSSCGGQTACNGRKGLEDRRVNIGVVVHGAHPLKRKAEIATKQAENCQGGASA